MILLVADLHSTRAPTVSKHIVERGLADDFRAR
jgi:hypothetical protein